MLSVSIEVPNWITNENRCETTLHKVFGSSPCLWNKADECAKELCEEFTPHVQCDCTRPWVCHCVPQTPVGRDYGWFNGVRLQCVLYAVAAPCMRRLLRGRLYDSQIMTHSSLRLQLSGFQQMRKLLNWTSHQRAHRSATVNYDASRRHSAAVEVKVWNKSLGFFACAA